jgi:Domain of unknown function (DUF4386)
MQAELLREAAVELRLERASPTWGVLYRVAGVAALAIVATLPVAVYVFLAWPPPTSIEAWFSFLQSNKLAAVIDLDLLLLIDQILFLPIILSLYITLRRVNEPLVLLGTVGAVIGAVLLIVSREATLTLPVLSDQFVAAASESERTLLLAAGLTLLTTFNGTAFSVGYALVGASGLLVTSMMLRGGIYNKATAYSGICMYVLMLVPPTIGTIGVALSLLSLAPLVPFQILLARRFFQLASDAGDR